MNFYQKKEVFERRNSLNDRATTKTLHVSLNFSPDERYPPEKLMRIATDYMEQLGFADQPYLVYQHTDAAHPHVHLVATTIRADGTRINTHNIGRNQSGKARLCVEQKYGLVKAQRETQKALEIHPLAPEIVRYGATETRRGIANVLLQVLSVYNYTSVPELNAVLRQFNVLADTGDKDSFINAKGGLYYRVLDTAGNKIGVPVKASSLPGKPTLNALSVRFEKNAVIRAGLAEKTRLSVDQVLNKNPRSMENFKQLLATRHIILVQRHSPDGRIYGLTYVDNANRSVFNGSQLGKLYSAAGLQKRFSEVQEAQSGAVNGLVEFNGLPALAAAMSPETEFNPLPYQLKKRKRRKKR